MSVTNSSVGRSWRTHAKHTLMNALVGQEFGAARYMPEINHHVLLDLTAGDAALVDDEPWHKTCSPGMLAYHASKSVDPVVVRLHEIQPSTYDRLISNLSMYLPALGYEPMGDDAWQCRDGHVILSAANISGHDASVDDAGSNSAVFVLNDPNAITSWAMRPTFASEISQVTPWFRGLSTMGCNAAGVKRLPSEERRAWFELVDVQRRNLPAYRDLLLAAIERDAHQWAYLVHTATKWRGKTEVGVRKAFDKVGRTAEMAWSRETPANFADAADRLFLTKTEYGAK